MQSERHFFCELTKYAPSLQKLHMLLLNVLNGNCTLAYEERYISKTGIFWTIEPNHIMKRWICLHLQVFKGLTNAKIHTLEITISPHDSMPMYECALMIWASYVFEWSKFSLTKSGRIFFFPFLFDFKVSKGYESLVLLFPTICSLLLRKSCEMTRKCQLGTWTDVVVAK